MLLNLIAKNALSFTLEPRCNEGPRDWQSVFAITKFVISRFFVIHFTIARVMKIVRYIEVPQYFLLPKRVRGVCTLSLNGWLSFAV